MMDNLVSKMDDLVVGVNSDLTSDKMEVTMGDLNKEIMQVVLSKMSVIEQLAFTRVSTRFKESAFKLTTVMDVEEEPIDCQIELLEKFPKLRKVRINYCQNKDESALKNQNFLRKLAHYHPNIERIHGVAPLFKLFYVEGVKIHNPEKDMSCFKSQLDEKFYETALEMYPGIKLNHRITEPASAMGYTSLRSQDQRFSDPCLKALEIEIAPPNYDLNSVLVKTQNITCLTIVQIGNLEFRPDYAMIFNSASGLKLRCFKIFIYKRDCFPKVYGWTPRDVKAFKLLLEVVTLKSITMHLPIGKPTFDTVLKCFLQCSKNNFRHFSCGQMLDNTTSDLPFILLPPCNGDPSMVVHFKPGYEDNFPMAQFLQKFNPKYREVEFVGPEAMNNVAKSLVSFIKNNPRFDFVLCSVIRREMQIFRPSQIKPNGEPYFVVRRYQ